MSHSFALVSCRVGTSSTLRLTDPASRGVSTNAFPKSSAFAVTNVSSIAAPSASLNPPRPDVVPIPIPVLSSPVTTAPPSGDAFPALSITRFVISRTQAVTRAPRSLAHVAPPPASNRKRKKYPARQSKLNLSNPRARRSRATDASARAPSLSVHPLASIPRPSNERAERALARAPTSRPLNRSFPSNTLAGGISLKPLHFWIHFRAYVQTERQGSSYRDILHLPPGEARNGTGADPWMSPHSRIVPTHSMQRRWMDGHRHRHKTQARPFTTRRWRYRSSRSRGDRPPPSTRPPDRAAIDRLPRPPDLDDRLPRPRPRVEWTTGSIEGAQCATDGPTDGRTERTERTDRTDGRTERTDRTLSRARSFARVFDRGARAREREI